MVTIPTITGGPKIKPTMMAQSCGDLTHLRNRYIFIQIKLVINN